MKSLIYQLIIFFVLPILTIAQDLDVSRNLNVKGNISIDGNSGTAGQVLMSNGANAPSWQTISAGSKFAILCSTLDNFQNDFDDALNGPTTQIPTLDYDIVLYKTLNDISININGNKITSNKTGLYHIEVFTKFRFVSNQAQNQLSYEVQGKIENVSGILLHSFFLDSGKMEQLGNNTNLTGSSHVTTDIYLTEGQSLILGAGFGGIANSTNPPTQMVVQSTYIRGYRISD